MGQLNSLASSELRELIEELARLAPDFIEVKKIPLKGMATKFVKCVNAKKQTFFILAGIKEKLNE